MPSPSSPGFPAVSPAQMAAVDRFLTGPLALDVLQLMELAGLAVARAAAALLPNADPRSRSVLVLAGRGGNGGDGLVAARLLAAWGALPSIVLSHPEPRLAPPAAHNLAAARNLGLPVRFPPDDPAAPIPPLPPADLLIDALLGFGLSGPPAGPAAALIRAANAHPAPILAVDLPSGLDAASGLPADPCIRAARTLTLALPKTGLLFPHALPFTGPVDVADIGVPAAAWASIGLDLPPLFAQSPVIPLHPR